MLVTTQPKYPIKNKIQLKLVGRISVKLPVPLSITNILSSTNVYKSTIIDMLNNTQSVDVALNLTSLINKYPIEINKREIKTGAMTGPHHGNGIRKSISHSKSDFGH